VPDRLRTLWIVSWLAVVLAAVLFVFRDYMPEGTTWLAVLAGVVLLFKWKGRYFGLQYIGDAARYLSPTPENVGVRQAIRSAAVELLEGLHDDPTWRRYHRIILVGHSLGSVIGYDAITHLWQRRHHPLKVYPSVEQDAQALVPRTPITASPFLHPTSPSAAVGTLAGAAAVGRPMENH
jgi:hypothetical protein